MRTWAIPLSPSLRFLLPPYSSLPPSLPVTQMIQVIHTILFIIVKKYATIYLEALFISVCIELPHFHKSTVKHSRGRVCLSYASWIFNAPSTESSTWYRINENLTYKWINENSSCQRAVRASGIWKEQCDGKNFSPKVRYMYLVKGSGGNTSTPTGEILKGQMTSQMELDRRANVAEDFSLISLFEVQVVSASVLWILYSCSLVFWVWGLDLFLLSAFLGWGQC